MNSRENRMQTSARKRRIVEFITQSSERKFYVTWSEIVRAADVPSGSMPRVMKELEQERKIVCIGTALDAFRTDVRRTYKIYAVFGTPILRKVEPVTHRRKLTAAPRAPRYKGERTGPQYHNWRTPELTPESYDLYAGRNLAMLAR